MKRNSNVILGGGQLKGCWLTNYLGWRLKVRHERVMICKFCSCTSGFSVPSHCLSLWCSWYCSGLTTLVPVLEGSHIVTLMRGGKPHFVFNDTQYFLTSLIFFWPCFCNHAVSAWIVYWQRLLLVLSDGHNLCCASMNGVIILPVPNVVFGKKGNVVSERVCACFLLGQSLFMRGYLGRKFTMLAGLFSCEKPPFKCICMNPN